MTLEQSKFYSLGRQAHEHGYSIESCNVMTAYRCWWQAGWIDRDIEMGNIKFWPGRWAA